MRRVVQFLGVALFVASTNSAGAASPVVHRPRLPAESTTEVIQAGWSSSNWSGYALSGTGVSAITGSWTVQSVAPSGHATYSSQWVGIDGFNNSSLIQTGTESDYYNGSAHYNAWWEILPAAETLITTVAVSPGDHISASIVKGVATSWTISIKDDTNGQSFTTTQTYSGPQTSAEWIEEAPTVGGRVATLANYGLTTFDPGTVNGGNPRLTAAESGIMVQRKVRVSTPSNPDSDTDGFNVEYGSTVPTPPAS